jgi:multicomponent Na+:H+ antiporter subunit C
MTQMPVVYTMCMVLFFTGLYGVVTKKNIVKIIISILIMENAVNLFILFLGYKKNGIAPVMSKGMSVDTFAATAVDPLTQAMVLTSIVIGFAMVAFMVAVAVRIYERYKTFDISEIKDLKR